jgi:ribonucleoside-diphosphate reductase alpha chain
MINTKTDMVKIEVIKRNGVKEILDFEKINQVLAWATEDIKGVNASDVAMNAKLQITNGINTKEIHEVLIQSAVDLITEDAPNYQYVASNLLNFYLRKNVFGVDSNLPKLYDVIQKNVKAGVYDPLILEQYTQEEIEKISKIIRHERDYRFTFAGLQQLIDKYLLRDRHTSIVYETPQFMYIMIAMTLFGGYEKTGRLQHIRKFYNDISLFKISLPTPIMCGVRTPLRQYSSCTLIDAGDSIDSLFASNAAVGYYTAKRAGIGLNMGRIRALGDRIRNGEVKHTGVVPFLKMFESTTRSCTQNGVRGGNSTTHFPYWHKEILDILVLKNNKGTDDNRVRKMDYSIQFNRLFYRKFVKNEKIALFSPHDVQDMYEAFFKSNDEFEALYEKYEADSSIEKKYVNARELMNSFSQERIGTGRIYLMNVDHANSHSSFLDTVYQSNLCQEITLPTYPLSHIDDGKMVKMQVTVKDENLARYEKFKKEQGLHNFVTRPDLANPFYKVHAELTTEEVEEGAKMFVEEVEQVYGDKPAEIALCVLSAINLGEVKDLSELEGICENIIRGLDFVIENQDYPVYAAKKMLKRRSVGVGITNLAYYLAKKDVKYDDPKALVILDELMEHIQYYLIKASVNMAKEVGACEWFGRTKYAQGILPIDTYDKNVDNIVKRAYTLNWEWLRAQILEHGMRHSTLTAMMPCESSSVVTNSTNGIEPIRSLITIKKSKQGLIKMLVPEAHKLKNKYTFAFDLDGNKGMTNITAVIQKWIDQGISANHYYNFKRYTDGNIPMSEIANDLLYFYKMGGKQLYYSNTDDNKTDDFTKMLEQADGNQTLETQVVDTEDDAGCGGACSI